MIFCNVSFVFTSNKKNVQFVVARKEEAHMSFSFPFYFIHSYFCLLNQVNTKEKGKQILFSI